jgi:UDP:flavonoid glycosyltransferase YjiC (YdhE family)
MDPMQVNILTIGTRGDVEPYLALGEELTRRGHRVVVQTLAGFGDAVHASGSEHRPIRGEFLADVRTHGVDAPGALARLGAYRRMAVEALEDEWEGAAGADLLVFNPAAWGGPHIAERLAIPAFAAFPTPLYTPTREFPSPFVPLRSLGPLNRLSHGSVARLGPVVFREPIARWRRAVLGLEGGPARRFPILYGFSEHVVPRPRDWPHDAHVTGYWFRDADEAWQPSESLVTFLAEGPPPVSIGFGSMVPRRPAELTREVLGGVRRTGRRAIIATGWGGLRPGTAGPDVHVVDALPHDWLFPRVAAIVHHGGAGTTAAGLRAGRPTVVCPFIPDQFFWGRRVAELGAGPRPIAQRTLTAERLASALDTACSDPMISARAADLGTLISAETGVDAAVDRILGSIASPEP